MLVAIVPLLVGTHAAASHARKIHGVNYGGRFIPEAYLGIYGTDTIMYKDVSPYTDMGTSELSVSLCDVKVENKQQRMQWFLDANIKDYHFTKMASQGFNTVRFPLGYWNLIDLPAGETPDGPVEAQARWFNLQSFQPSAASYMKWIDQVFTFAEAAGMQVLMDLHGAAGGQNGNQNAGCYLGSEGHYFLNTTRNFDLSVQAIERMGEICAAKGDTCLGIQLLNEPCCAWPDGSLPRDSLASFYQDAIRAARKHMATEQPIFIMDWAEWLDAFWKHRARTLFADGGNIVFSSHFYELNPETYALMSSQDAYTIDLGTALDFQRWTGYDVVITEWTLAGHGSGNHTDVFPYGDLTRWLVHEFDRLGGSMIWNFDSYFSSWGAVDKATLLGQAGVPWHTIHGLKMVDETKPSTATSSTLDAKQAVLPKRSTEPIIVYS